MAEGQLGPDLSASREQAPRPLEMLNGVGKLPSLGA